MKLSKVIQQRANTVQTDKFITPYFFAESNNESVYDPVTEILELSIGFCELLIGFGMGLAAGAYSYRTPRATDGS